MNSTKQNTEAESGFVAPEFADEWEAIEDENRTIGFESADWVPFAYTLTHAARRLTEEDLSVLKLTAAGPLIDALQNVQWPSSKLPIRVYSQSDVRLHTTAPCGSAEYSYAYCFGRYRFDIYAGSSAGRGVTDDEFSRGLLSQMSKLSGLPETIIAKAKQFTGVGGPSSMAQDEAEPA